MTSPPPKKAEFTKFLLKNQESQTLEHWIDDDVLSKQVIQAYSICFMGFQEFVAVLHSSVLNKQLYCSKISLSRYSVVSVRGRQIVSLCGLLVDRSLGAV